MTRPKAKIDRDNLLFRLALLTRRWRQVLDTEIQTSGLTDATWRPLLHLHLLGDGTRQKDLAESLGIREPSIVRLIDTLLVKGLIRRSEDATDRRAKLLFLTLQGQVLVDQIQETVMSLEQGLLAAFDEGEVSQMVGFVARLEASLSKVIRPVQQ